VVNLTNEELKQTIKEIVTVGKGILAADESVKTATKRLVAINTESTEETRRQYRNMILTSPGIEKYILGVILFEETLSQKSNDGVLFPEFLAKLGIVPGIKVDKGLEDINDKDEQITTKGLEGLGERLEEYKKMGCRFAKWRVVYLISKNTPSDEIIEINAQDLARYAKVCQEHGIVPIIEPEVLIDGTHSIDKSEEVNEKVLIKVFEALEEEEVDIKTLILKTSMIISGNQANNRASVDEVAKRTAQLLKKVVPPELPSINFLSGGQTPLEATAHLNRIHTLGKEFPWNVSFSYARALQGPALKVWQGKDENLLAAQKAFIFRAKLNSLATKGKYKEEMEEEV
jgi:fructose-bisphosphate aldolase class I|tara:strand:+ start:1032 stop:2063 length:1032 start_codon:yes stop_codon:yes gene_type:complete